jgi:hypothetical protein
VRRGSITKKLIFEADITLMLREIDAALLLNALRSYKPITEEEKHSIAHLLGVLEYLTTEQA